MWLKICRICRLFEPNSPIAGPVPTLRCRQGPCGGQNAGALGAVSLFQFHNRSLPSGLPRLGVRHSLVVTSGVRRDGVAEKDGFGRVAAEQVAALLALEP